MMIKKIALLTSGLLLGATAAQAQVAGVLDGLTGPQGAVGNALTTVNGATAPLLDSVGLGNALGNNGLLPSLNNALTGSLPGAGDALSLDNLPLGGVLANTTALPQLPSISGLPLGMQLAGDLPVASLLSPSSLDAKVLEAVLFEGVSALPAGVLPSGTAIPVDSLGGLPNTLLASVSNGQIAAGLLPADLPISARSLDAEVISQVLSQGIPAALLPSTTLVRADTLR